MRRVFRAWLGLLPRTITSRYAEDIAADFDLEFAERWKRRPLDAVAFALRAFAEVPMEAVRSRRGGGSEGEGPAASWRDDLGNAFRSLRRSPGWTAVAVAILSVGIGGTVAVFSVLQAVLLEPLPYRQDAELVAIWTHNLEQDLPDGSSWENARDWVERSRTLDEMALVFRPEFTSATVTATGEPERVEVGVVGDNFFTLLGVEARMGRVFGPGDAEGESEIAVISEGYWKDRFGSDPDVVGRTITIGGEEAVIVGVAPSNLELPLRQTRVWQPLNPRPADGRDRRHTDAYRVVGRLAAGETVASAQSELDRVAAELAVEFPDANRGRGVRVHSLRSEIVGDGLPLLLWTVLGAMVMVLLVAGTNVAQLLFSRALRRRREIAVRAAMGASRARIGRQLLLETAIVGLLAGGAGVLIAYLGIELLVGLVPPEVPLASGTRMDARALSIALGIGVLLAPMIGALPALRATSARPASLLKSASRTVVGADRRLRSGLVVAEVAVAVVLLVGAGLMVRSALELNRIDPGFDDRGTLIARIDLERRMTQPELVGFWGEVTDRLQARPDVEGVAVTGRFLVERKPDATIEIIGDPPRDPSAPTPKLSFAPVLPGYFRALGIPITRGRGVLPTDNLERLDQVVVNQAWVDAFARDRDPIGLQFRWAGDEGAPSMTVVGVAGDVRRTRLDEAAYPFMFGAHGNHSADVLVRTEGDPLALAEVLRRVMAEYDPGSTVSDISTVRDRYEASMVPRRIQAWLIGLFAVLAVALSAVGLFAVMSESVQTRRKEFGIRTALGATPGRLRSEILVEAARLCGAGLALGFAAASSMARLADRLVFGISAFDPVTLASVAGVVGAVALLASWVPAAIANRASSVQSLLGD